MKNKLFFMFCIILSLGLFSCVYGTNNILYGGNNVNNRISKIVELKDFIDKDTLPERYNILVITDTHFGSPFDTPKTAEFDKWLNNLDKNAEGYPKFCLILGDNVDRGYEEEYETYRNFVGKIENAGIPVISTVGNHDLYNCGWDLYKKYCYPKCSLFHFNTKAFSWYGIDTGTGIVGAKQFNLIKKGLRNDDKNKIIISHYPLTNSKWYGAVSFHDSTERNLLIDLYAKNNVTTVLCGHLHEIAYRDIGPFREYGHPSFCYSGNFPWTLYEIDESNLESPKITQLPRNF